MAENTIQVQKSTLWMIATFVILGIFVVYLLATSLGGNSTGNAVAPDGQDAPSAKVKVSVNENDPILGNKDAKISVVEFSDFECPFCSRAYFDTVAGLKSSSYFTDGEVNFVYKHLPLTSIHPDAMKAAEATVCAQEQGKFWEYHDILFENQQSLGVQSLKQYAADIGLNTEEFNNCLDSGEGKDKVSADMKEASLAGARGTPHFVVYNQETGETMAVSGAVPFANLEEAIQAVM